ncbi:hypothetical protein X992_4154 [Burkholderia pseudomallei MSHR5492]|nr:hypothetical protein DO70_2279 [Burkholderia pseudomallei]KGS43403.1 hypothetical protein X992_4154 [Burkholderia pseudomallei MSHR5492]KGX69804.1 hypothetical protein Y026_4140 [Burkholderia pseudomallei TSV28]
MVSTSMRLPGSFHLSTCWKRPVWQKRDEFIDGFGVKVSYLGS